jgi:carboxyl-terminal processing protease
MTRGFYSTTSDELTAAMANLKEQGATSLVLDLRGNPGGLLNAAIEVAQKFLRAGDLVVATQGRAGAGDRHESRAAGRVHLTDFPMVVLVNGGTASASEIVAGALQDHRRAVLVGDTTYGKGSVQSLVPLASDKRIALRLTIAYYYTPSGRLIHDKGLDPDIPIEVGPEEWRKVQVRRAHLENPQAFSDQERKEYAEVRDRVLERAVDIARALTILK